MEKHWRSVISRSVCDYFFEAQTKATSPSDIPPVIPTPHYYLITIYRNNLYFVAVLQNEGKSIEIYTCIHYWWFQYTGVLVYTLGNFRRKNQPQGWEIPVLPTLIPVGASIMTVDETA